MSGTSFQEQAEFGPSQAAQNLACARLRWALLIGAQKRLRTRVLAVATTAGSRSPDPADGDPLDDYVCRLAAELRWCQFARANGRGTCQLPTSIAMQQKRTIIGFGRCKDRTCGIDLATSWRFETTSWHKPCTARSYKQVNVNWTSKCFTQIDQCSNGGIHVSSFGWDLILVKIQESCAIHLFV